MVAFPATNNEAKYKAIIVGLKICKTLDAKNARVFNDS